MGKETLHSTDEGIDWANPGQNELAMLKEALRKGVPDGWAEVLIDREAGGFRFTYDSVLTQREHEGSAIYCRLIGIDGDVFPMKTEKGLLELVFAAAKLDEVKVAEILAKAKRLHDKRQSKAPAHANR